MTPIVIAHRANLYGQCPTLENTLPLIHQCIEMHDLDVETDLWCIDQKLYLGHDTPAIPVDEAELYPLKHKLWIHAKNLEALNFALDYGYRTFFHNIEERVLTSTGHIWTFPKHSISSSKCVAVILGSQQHYSTEELLKCYGVCTDFPLFYRKLFTENNDDSEL